MKNFGMSLVILALAPLTFAGNPKSESLKKISRPGVYSGYAVAEYKGFSYQSYYVPVKDSTLLAVDVFLPKNLEKGKKIPAIVYPTRYNRSIKAKFPISLFKDPVLVIVSEEEVNFFTSYGYACVIIDARGSGASMGTRNMEFSPQEIADGNDIINWIVKQPWCDGQLATSGISYGATAAELLLANQNPAVKACIPRSGIFDLFGDIMFPGGICQGPFVDVWSFTTQSLDNNNYDVFGKKAKYISGIHPVKHDHRKRLLQQAIQSHRHNFNVFDGLKSVKCRDDYNPELKAAADDFSVHSYRDLIAHSGAAIYRMGGWYDGALAKSCTDGFLSIANTEKVLIGPWDHGPHDNASPYALSPKIDFDIYTEMLRFLDYHLKGIANGIDNEPPFTYFTIGEETWENSNSWPPSNEQAVKMYLSSDHALVNDAQQAKTGAVPYEVDYSATSGSTSRWNSVTALYRHGHTHYGNRQAEDEKLLTFTSPPLNAPTEITGHPVVSLRFSADANDATVFCYLEDVAPDSSVTYVTEGMLRPSFRKLSDDAVYTTAYPDHSYRKQDEEKYKKGEVVDMVIDLLPISYQFKKDHCIRIAIAGADAGHFDLPDHKPAFFTIGSDEPNNSYLYLPVVSK